MNKLWYIVKEDHHFGPFNEIDLQKMFEDQRITRKTTLVRRGLKEPIIVNDLIKRKARTRRLNPETGIFQEFPYKTLFSKFTQIEVPKTCSNKVVRPVLRKPQRSNLDYLSKIKFNFLRSKVLISSLAIFCFLFIMASLFIWRENSRLTIVRPTGVDHAQFRVFEEKLQDAYSKRKHKWDLISSKDLKQVWLGTSLPGEQNVRLRFQSVQERVLSKKPVEFLSRLKVTDGIGEIRELKFTKGDRVVPGIYKVSILIETHHLNFFQKLFSANINAKKSSKLQVLLKSHSKKSFIKELVRFNSLAKSQNNKFIQDIQMKYETLMTIAQKISANLSNAQKGLGSKTQVNHMKKYFLNDYQNKYGNFFSNFVIENESRFKDLTSSPSEIKNNIISHYSTLSEIARSLGLISLDAIDSFSELTQNSEAFRPVLKRYEKVMQICDKKLQALKNTKI